MAVAFKCNTGEIGIELEGPEEFVRAQMEFLVPWVRRVGGGGLGDGAAADAAAPLRSGFEGVADWWRREIPGGTSPTLQDTILIFAAYMRTYRKTVFVSEDIRRCFQVMGVEGPKSLLQILGTLKRDHGLLLAAGKRGEYMMSIPGINRARQLLGGRSTAFPGAGAGAGGDGSGAEPAKGMDARSIFKD